MRRIRPDDFQRGDLITRLHGSSYINGAIPDGEGGVRVLTGQDRSYMGDLFQVLHVEWPYIIMTKLAARSGHREENSKPQSVHTGEYIFAKVSKTFAETLYGGPIPELPPLPEETLSPEEEAE